MKKLLTILFISVCILACEDSAKKEFLEHSQEKAVIDISNKAFFLNGQSSPNIYAEAFNSEDLLIRNLQELLDAERTSGARAVNIHIDSTEAFKFLFKTLATIGFSGYTNFQIVLGNDYQNHVNTAMPNLRLQYRLAKRMECFDDAARLARIRGESVKASISLGANLSKVDSLMESICSRKSTDGEKRLAEERLKIILDQKRTDYLALSLEFLENCPANGIQGECWKLESNDIADPQYISKEDIKTAIQLIYNENTNSTRKDQNELAFIVPDETPISAVLPIMKIINEVGFSIQLARQDNTARIYVSRN